MKTKQEFILECFAQLTAILNSVIGEQKAVAHRAIDMEDWVQGEEAFRTARQNQALINSWKDRLDVVKTEITSSAFFTEVQTDKGCKSEETTDEIQKRKSIEQVNASIEQESCIENEQLEEEKIGKYVRNKMRELAASGYLFSKKQIEEMTTKAWSTTTFHSSSCEFFRRYNENMSLREQLKGFPSDSRNRFWNEIFIFGNEKVLISSQWYEHQRIYFDEWYNDLESDELVEIQEKDTYGDVPRAVCVCNHEYAVQNWEDMIISVCEHMVLAKPYVMALIDKDMPCFKFNEVEARSRMINPKQLSNGLWVEAGVTGEDAFVCVNKVISLCGYSHSDFIVK